MVGINRQFPGPIINVTTNWNVVVNVKNNLDEPLLFTWYSLCMCWDGPIFSIYLCNGDFKVDDNDHNVVGMVYSRGETLGRMVFWEQIVLSLPVGTGHTNFRSKIKLGASFISLLLASRKLQVVLEGSS